MRSSCFAHFVGCRLESNEKVKVNIHRDVAQLVARLVWDQDVAGSNPVIPTNFGIHKAFEY